MNISIFGIFFILFFIHSMRNISSSIAPKIGMKYLSVKRNNQSKPSYLDSKKNSQNQIQIISCCFFCYCYNENARANDQGLLKFTTRSCKFERKQNKKSCLPTYDHSNKIKRDKVKKKFQEHC